MIVFEMKNIYVAFGLASPAEAFTLKVRHAIRTYHLFFTANRKLVEAFCIFLRQENPLRS